VWELLTRRWNAWHWESHCVFTAGGERVKLHNNSTLKHHFAVSTVSSCNTEVGHMTNFDFHVIYFFNVSSRELPYVNNYLLERFAACVSPAPMAKHLKWHLKPHNNSTPKYHFAVSTVSSCNTDVGHITNCACPCIELSMSPQYN
jgi:hypothetical protein